MTSEKPKVEAPLGWRVPDPAAQERLRRYEEGQLRAMGLKPDPSKGPKAPSASADLIDLLGTAYYLSCLVGLLPIIHFSVQSKSFGVSGAYVILCVIMAVAGGGRLAASFVESTEHLNLWPRRLAIVAGGIGWYVINITTLVLLALLANILPGLPPGSDGRLVLPIVVLFCLIVFGLRRWPVRRLERPRKIFISYRRDDSAASAARIGDRLAQTIGRKRVFMDIDNLTAGQRFDQELGRALAQCTVLIAVIGRRWAEILQQRMQSSERDYVREEIVGALRRGLLVIPVLVDGATLPQADLLPPDIRNLVFHQKHTVEHERFGRDVDDLINAIKIGGKLTLARATTG